MLDTGAIHIRDPFILPEPAEKAYYMFGTTDQDAWNGPGKGFDCFKSSNLSQWDGPIPAFRPPPSFWGALNFWAPEVHRFNSRYYMLASFKAPGRYRGTQVLVSGSPAGPYAPITDGPVTPPDWECLDGTLHIDSDGKPWIVFCHEWVQIHNGAIYAMRLSLDLAEPAGRPVFLFNASEAPWVRRQAWPADGAKYRFPTYITDGPFVFRNSSGKLLMLWSSSGSAGYAMGLARSESGHVCGPWRQEPQALWSRDGGHGMVFRKFSGELFVTFHSPNKASMERPVFLEIEETGDGIRLKTRRPAAGSA